MARLSRVSASRSIDEVAGGVGGGGADEGDVDRERLVEQPLLAVELDQPDEILGGGGVDLAAALARVDEGAQADLGEGAGLAGGDVAVEVRDAALRQVVGLDPVLDREPADLGDQPPMAADDALREPVMAQPVQPLLLAVALPRREQQGQVARLAGRDEALLERRPADRPACRCRRSPRCTACRRCGPVPPPRPGSRPCRGARPCRGRACRWCWSAWHASPGCLRAA